MPSSGKTSVSARYGNKKNHVAAIPYKESRAYKLIFLDYSKVQSEVPYYLARWPIDQMCSCREESNSLLKQKSN